MNKNYMIAKAASSEELAETVNELIAEGWAPMGGCSTSIIDYTEIWDRSQMDHTYYEEWAQAMTKKG